MASIILVPFLLISCTRAERIKNAEEWDRQNAEQLDARQEEYQELTDELFDKEVAKTTAWQQLNSMEEKQRRAEELSRPLSRRVLSEEELKKGMLYLQRPQWFDVKSAIYYLPDDSAVPRFLSEIATTFNATGTQFTIRDGSVYFLNDSNDIAALDLSSGELTTAYYGLELAAPCTESPSTIQAFSFQGPMFVYIVGPCTVEGEYRFASILYVLDTETSRIRQVADVTEMVEYGIAFYEDDVPPGTVRLYNLYVDVGYGSGTMYEVDLSTGEKRTLTELSLDSHCDDTEYGDYPCDETVLKANEEYRKYFPDVLTTTCGSRTVEEKWGLLYLIDERGETELPSAEFIACLSGD